MLDEEKRLDTVFIFTESYPFKIAKEDNFISPEIKYVAARAKRIVLIPFNMDEYGFDGQGFPTNVEVDISLAQLNARSHFKPLLIRIVSNASFLNDLLSHPNTLTSLNSLRSLMGHYNKLLYFDDWIKKEFNQKYPSSRTGNSVIYTYWFDIQTDVLSNRFKKELIISRAHGIDVYEFRRPMGFIPGRKKTLKNVNNVYSVSKAGVRYIQERYPEYASKVEFMPLGIEDPGGICDYSKDGFFRILSCSYVLPVKRVELIATYVKRFAAKHPESKIVWNHIGGGSSSEIEKVFKEMEHLPENLQVEFLGAMELANIYEYYRTNFVDVFLTLSASEGRPFSIMEALAFGVPILATGVGGIPEMFEGYPETGKLLSETPSFEEFETALLAVISNPDLSNLRTKCRKNWEMQFCASINFERFYEQVQGNIKKK